MGLRLGNCGKLSKRKATILTIFIISIWISLVAVVGYLNISRSDTKALRVIENIKLTDLKSGVYINARLTTIDIFKYQYTVHLDFWLTPDLVDKTVNDPLASFGSLFTGVSGGRVPKQQITVLIGSVTINFPAKAIMGDRDIVISLISGDTNDYPFDKFGDQFSVVAVFGSPIPSNISTPASPAQNLHFSLGGAIQGWSFDNKITLGEPPIDFSPFVFIQFARSYTTIFFSLFIIVTMWVLSSLVLALAISVWIRGRKVEPPTIVICTGMLFALSAVRNAQPGIPTVGCTADVIGFFWNMIMIAVAASLLLVNYIVKYKGEKKLETNVYKTNFKK